jgi:phospholipase/carboxylesterase
MGAAPTSTTSSRCSTRSTRSGASPATRPGRRSSCPRAARTGTRSPASRPTRDHFLASYELLCEFLDALPYERVVLGGFSQGCVMAYALAFGKGRPRPAALLALSGFVPRVEGFELDLTPPFPPIVVAHGAYDPVIPVQFGREARDLLTGAGADVDYRESPIEHWIDPQVVPLLREVVAGAATR